MAKGQDPRPGIGGETWPLVQPGYLWCMGHTGLAQFVFSPRKQDIGILGTVLSRASLAPPKANNLSHFSQKFAVLSLPSRYGHVRLGNPPYSHLEFRGMKENLSCLKQLRISAERVHLGRTCSWFIRSAALLLEEKQPEPVATWGAARYCLALALAAPAAPLPSSVK